MYNKSLYETQLCGANGDWWQDGKKGNESLKQGAWDFSYRLYHEEFSWRAKLYSINSRFLGEMIPLSLEREFIEEEILGGLMYCSKDKTLDLDGFKMGFM